MKKSDITQHVLVPNHTKLSEQKKADVLKKYNISVYQLPQILKSDPAIARLNPKPGDVIKIVRKSQTAGKHVFYRVVVSA